MKFATLCSGIGAPELAFFRLGWTAVFCAEIEPFPCAVLKHHWPTVPNLGDVNAITRDQVEAFGAVDLVMFGFPCQDLSVAGKRKGLKDADGNVTRSGLFYRCVEIARWTKARWIVAENVRGLFSSNQGRDFGAVVGELAGAEFDVPRDGWANAGFALGKHGLVEWRTLDAQFDHLAQRRERVFFVLDTGDWADRPPVLSDCTGLRWHPAPCRETRKDVAPTISARTKGGGGLGTDFDLDGGLVAHSLRADGFDASEDGTGRGTPLVAATLRTGSNNASSHNKPSGLDENLIPEIADCLQERDSKGSDSNTKNGHLLPVAFPAHLSSALQADNPTAVAVAMRQREGCTGAGKGPLLSEECSLTRASENDQTVFQPATAFECRMVRTTGGQPQEELSHALRADTNSGDGAPCVSFVKKLDTERLQGLNIYHGDATETDTIEILRSLRHEIGEKAFSEWGLGILVSFLPPEILRSAVHGKGIRCPTNEEFGLVNYSLPCKETPAERFVREMRETQRNGCSSFGWEPHEQRSIKLAAYLSQLSLAGASPQSVLFHLRKASEGTGVLRHALPTIQEVGQSARSEGQSVHRPSHGQRGEPSKDLLCSELWESVSCEWLLWETRNASPSGKTFQVRRLSVVECEFLQGFPRNFTLITYRGKPACDGPRYKAIGNSMAVPVVEWLGRQIEAVQQFNQKKKRKNA